MTQTQRDEIMVDAKSGIDPSRPTVDWVALGGIVITVALHVYFQAQGPNPSFIISACVFWAGYVLFRARTDRSAFRRWGFRVDNLLQASIVPAAIFAVAAIAMGSYAHWHGRLWFAPQNALLFLLYPFWGVAQQFLTLGVAVRNLELVPAVGNRKPLLVLIGAVLFSAVHFPDLWAVLATFFLELVLVPLYLRYRNLWPLGIIHGWLGLLFYFWVIGRDLWSENFG